MPGGTPGAPNGGIPGGGPIFPGMEGGGPSQVLIGGGIETPLITPPGTPPDSFPSLKALVVASIKL